MHAVLKIIDGPLSPGHLKVPRELTQSRQIIVPVIYDAWGQTRAFPVDDVPYDRPPKQRMKRLRYNVIRFETSHGPRATALTFDGVESR